MWYLLNICFVFDTSANQQIWRTFIHICSLCKVLGFTSSTKSRQTWCKFICLHHCLHMLPRLQIRTFALVLHLFCYRSKYAQIHYICITIKLTNLPVLSRVCYLRKYGLYKYRLRKFTPAILIIKRLFEIISLPFQSKT